MAQKSSSGRSTWAALIAVVVLVLALVWTIQAIVAHNKLQNCVDSGRRDCLAQPNGDGG
jgi:hypothetical protein